MTKKNRDDLGDTRDRIAATSTNFFRQAGKLQEKNNSQAAGKILHILAVEKPRELNREQIRELAEELAGQEDQLVRSVGEEIRGLVDTIQEDRDFTGKAIVSLQRLPEIQLLTTAYEFAEQYDLGIYTLHTNTDTESEAGEVPVTATKEVPQRIQKDELGGEDFRWSAPEEVTGIIDTQTKVIRFEDEEVLQLTDLPPPMVLVIPLESLTTHFLAKVTTILRSQLRFDGYQYYYWKDLMDAVHTSYNPDGNYPHFTNYTPGSSSPVSDRLHDEIVTRANALVIANRYGNPARAAGQLFEEYVPDSTVALILERISDARAVIFGLRPAVLTFPLRRREIEALEEAFFALNHIAGVNIKVVDLGSQGTYIYDEYALIKKLSKKDFLIGVTESGMAQLIRRDVLRQEGTFYRMVDEFSEWNIIKGLVLGYRRKVRALNALLEEGLAQRVILKRRHHIEIPYLVTCTFRRPDAFAEAMKMYAQNLELFGHKEDITIFVLDNTPTEDLRSDDMEKALKNRDVIEEYRRKGFKVRYLSYEEQKYLRALYKKRFTELHKVDISQEGLFDQEFVEKVRGDLQAVEYLLRKELLTETGKGKYPTVQELLTEVRRNRIKGVPANKLESIPEDELAQIPITKEAIEEEITSRIIEYTFATSNIAGARTVTVALTKGKMGNFDDDSLPQAAVVRRNDRQQVYAVREAKREELVKQMYQEISEALAISIESQEDFDTLLTGVSVLSKIGRDVLNRIIEKYYRYSPDGSTGLIPQALGQMRQVKSEQRLRFQREHNRGQAQIAFNDPSELDEEKGKEVWLVTTEDDEQVPLQHITEKDLGMYYDDTKAGEPIPDYDAATSADTNLRIREGNYDLLPVDFLWVGDQTLGTYTGQRAVGMLATDDERGIGIQPLRQLWIARALTDLLDLFPPWVLKGFTYVYSWITSTLLGRYPGSQFLQAITIKRMGLCSMHFNNARDNASEALFNESERFWKDHNKGKVDPRDLQQVVMMTIHRGVRGLNSIRFSRWNQDCFNLKTMKLPKPIPTNGAWLRTEEPYYKQLVEFIFVGYSMAWARVVGGHKRLWQEQRPNLPKQSTWEEMAMAAWDLYDVVFLQLFRKIRFALTFSAYKRLKILGERYITESAQYKLSEKNKTDFEDTRERIAATVVRFFTDAQRLQQEKNTGAAVKMYHLWAIEGSKDPAEIALLNKTLLRETNDATGQEVAQAIQKLADAGKINEKDLFKALQRLPEIQLLITAYQFAEQYALGVYTLDGANGEVTREIPQRREINEMGVEEFSWIFTQESATLDRAEGLMRFSDGEIYKIPEGGIPRTVVIPVQTLTEEFFRKLTTILRAPLRFDGYQYYYWANIMDTVHAYYHPDGEYEDFQRYTRESVAAAVSASASSAIGALVVLRSSSSPIVSSSDTLAQISTRLRERIAHAHQSGNPSVLFSAMEMPLRTASGKALAVIGDKDGGKGGGQATYMSDVPAVLASYGLAAAVAKPLFSADLKAAYGDKMAWEDFETMLYHQRSLPSGILHEFLEEFQAQVLGTLEVPVGLGTYSIKVIYLEQKGVPVFLLLDESCQLFVRLYYQPHPDSLGGYLESIILPRATLMLQEMLEVEFDVIHFNDWQTALGPAMLKELYRDHRWTNGRCPKAFFTTHNLEYQGVFPGFLKMGWDDHLIQQLLHRGIVRMHDNLYNGDYYGQVTVDLFKLTGLPIELRDRRNNQGFEFWSVFPEGSVPGRHNLMKGAFIFSDIIVFVSEGHMYECMTLRRGYGVDGVLRGMKAKLRFAYNGLDVKTYLERLDSTLQRGNEALEGRHRFRLFGELTDDDLEWRQHNQRELQLVLKLATERQGDLLLVNWGRLVKQKGLDIFFTPISADGGLLIDEMLKIRQAQTQARVQLAILGTAGDPLGEKLIVLFSRRADEEGFEGQFAFVKAFDSVLSTQMAVGGFVGFMPSIDEPGGYVNQEGAVVGLPFIGTDRGGPKDFYQLKGTLIHPVPGFDIDQIQIARLNALIAGAAFDFNTLLYQV
ncbi:MAG: glycogen/starch synthase, partial [Candidatus Omnitrophica bacterium]|nr:glycogen/starch synthase [Candidatus Omnitrophota bacterium]